MQSEANTRAFSTRAIFNRANGGDREALEALLLRMRPRLRAWVALCMGPALKAKLDADDIVQEILVKAASAIRSFEPRGRRAFHAWLFAIARHQLHSIHHTQSGPATWSSRREELDHVLRTLTHLPERHREVIRLRNIEFLPNAEAARELGTTPSNASLLYIRAMTELRKRLRRGVGS